MLSPSEKQRLNQYAQKDSGRLSELFDALSDDNRCKLFRIFVKQNGLNVTEAASILGMSVPLTSQHLKVLEQAQLLKRQKRGREVFYAPNHRDSFVQSLIKAITT